MNNRKKLHIVICTAALLCSLSVSAQNNFQTGYFLDGYTYRYRLNPAFQGDTGFIGLLPISDLGLGLRSNIGIDNFIMPNPDGSGLVTGLHPSISAQQFLSPLSNDNRLDFNLETNILAFGFRTKRFYHTFDVSLSANAGASIPKDIFSFLKEGTNGGSDFDLSGLRVNASSFATVAYGISMEVNDKITWGVRLKGLVGVGHVNVGLEKGSAHFGGDEWAISTKGSASLAFCNSTFTLEPSESNPGNSYVSGVQIGKIGPAGFGGAVDLGITYKPIPDLTISAAVLDLGLMQWKAIVANTDETQVKYVPADNIDVNAQGGGTIGDQFSDAFGSLQSIYELYPGESANVSERLTMTANLGVEYRLAAFQPLSFGLLGTLRNSPYDNVMELRASVNLAPCTWFSMSVSGSTGTYGWDYGAAINIHTVPFKFFLGADCFIKRITPQFLPLGKTNASLRMGVNFGFGKVHTNIKYKHGKKAEKK